MAVQYVQGGGNGLLGGLGALAMLGGTLTGNPFLTTLGTGLGTANNILNGGTGVSGVSGQGGQGGVSLWDFMSKVLGQWQNPASNGKPKTDAELYKSWSPYDPNAGRGYF